MVISSWGIVNLIKQKCENTLKWFFHQFLSCLEAIVTGIGHFIALSHTGHCRSSPLLKPSQLCLPHIHEFEVLLTTITSVWSFPFHRTTKLHASQHCCPSVVICWPQSLRAVPAPMCVPHRPQSLQKHFLPKVCLQPQVSSSSVPSACLLP